MEHDDGAGTGPGPRQGTVVASARLTEPIPGVVAGKPRNEDEPARAERLDAQWGPHRIGDIKPVEVVAGQRDGREHAGATVGEEATYGRHWWLVGEGLVGGNVVPWADAEVRKEGPEVSGKGGGIGSKVPSRDEGPPGGAAVRPKVLFGRGRHASS